MSSLATGWTTSRQRHYYEDARIMLLDALQPKKETFYEADVESESEENEKDI